MLPSALVAAILLAGSSLPGAVVSEPANARIASERRERAPQFALEDVRGRTVRLSDFRGKVVIVEFWATWCGPCVRGLPVLADVARRAGSDVVFLAVNTDDSESKERVRDFLRERKLDITALLRGRDVSKSFGVGPIPHTVVIARDGTIVATHVGFHNENAVRDRLAKDIAIARSRR
jgi:thiol-disulfide isomerase/thioredoxin